MPDIHGEIGDGKFGVMSEAQILDWLVGKLPHLPSTKFRSNMQSCINDVLIGRGKDTGGRTFDSEQILHTSAGKSGQADSCTIFYAKRDNDVAKVVGIGSHTSGSSYDVYWSVSNCLGRSVSL